MSSSHSISALSPMLRVTSMLGLTSERCLQELKFLAGSRAARPPLKAFGVACLSPPRPSRVNRRPSAQPLLTSSYLCNEHSFRKLYSGRDFYSHSASIGTPSLASVSCAYSSPSLNLTALLAPFRAGNCPEDGRPLRIARCATSSR
jgi:hypothetical protein